MALLEGRVAVVTGAGTGIGRELAVACAREGARVAVAGLSDGTCESTVRVIAAEGGEAVAVGTDVARSEAVDAMVATVVERLGGVDILVNNAALIPDRRPFDEIGEDDWDRTLAVNLKGAWLCAKAAAPHMRSAGWGRIVNITSDTVISGVAGMLHYVSSKGALVAFTRSLATELGESGITVNAIAPGFTETEAALRHGREAAQRSVERRAIARAETPADLAGTLLYLASPLADFVTGQLIAVNGGYVYH
jgi:NAD(P)-dependent dehydrogenase (short-subunit alcohol dehydrogenase family)